jgi:hypothetical protein
MTPRLGSLLLAFGIAASTFACGPAKEPDAGVASDLSKADGGSDGTESDESASKTNADDKAKGPVYPAPFTAEQIQRATKNGRTYRFRVEVPDKAPTEYTVAFRNVDSGGAEVFSEGDKGKRMSWLAFQQHAEFPKDKVTTRADRIKIPAGKFDCLVYEVTGDRGEVRTYYFAKKLPGAPVFFYVERDGQRIRTTTLLEHDPGRD